MKGPNIPKNLVVEDPVSTLDIPATFYDYSKISKPMELNGKSLMGIMRDKERRDFAFNEWDLRSSRTGLELNLRVARTKDAKLIYEEISDTYEMYILSEDPVKWIMYTTILGYSKIQKELMDMIKSRPNDALSSDRSSCNVMNNFALEVKNLSVEFNVRGKITKAVS